MPVEEQSVEPAGGSTLALVRLGVLVVLLAGIGIVLLVSGTEGLANLLTEIGESRWGFVAFVLAYSLAVVVLLPGTLGTLTAGAIFGFPLGGFAALLGSSLGCTMAFFISRLMGREGAQQLIGGRLMSADEFIGRNDFGSILVLRLMPVVPFNLLNYGAGLTSARPSRYVLASIVGMAPGAFLTTALADQADNPTGTPFLILVAVFLVALVGSVVVGQRLRKKEPTTDV